MLVGDLDEVSYDLEVDGHQIRRTLHRKVWIKRGWATVVLAFQDRERDGSWKPAKLALIRLQRAQDAWKKHGAITLAGPEALDLAGAIEAWRSELVDGHDEAGA